MIDIYGMETCHRDKACKEGHAHNLPSQGDPPVRCPRHMTWNKQVTSHGITTQLHNTLSRAYPTSRACRPCIQSKYQDACSATGM